MLDYLALQGSTEYPTFYTILYTILISVVLSSLIAYTYKITNREIVVPINFLQSLILLSILSSTVMQAIGDSLARGLGMLGALAIIRFRTTLKTPRNMVFTFAALTAGIACGVYGYVIAITGVVGFCTVSIVLRFSPLSRVNQLVGILKFQISIVSEITEIEKILSEHCIRYFQVGYNISKTKETGNDEDGLTTNVIAYEYQISLTDVSKSKYIHNQLVGLQGIDKIKLNFQTRPENV